MWGRKMMELQLDSESWLLAEASWMLKASVFSADATLDSLIFASRAMASLVVARRAIWLWVWQADICSKYIVASYPFKGEKLFGSHLDKILVET